MALEFNGTSGDVNCGSGSSLDNIFDSGASVSAWFYAYGWGTGTGALFHKASDDYPHDGWSVFIADFYADSIVFVVDFSFAVGAWRFPTNTVVFDTLFHVFVTYNSSSTVNDPLFYLNGQVSSVVQLQNPIGSRVTDAGEDMLLGTSVTGNFVFDGWMTDMRVYNRIVSAPEIQTIYHARGHDAIVDGLVSRWLLNEGAPGVTASGSGACKDVGVGANHGTPSGTVVYIADPLEFGSRVA